MKERRTFTREFKLAAVKKVVEQGLSVAEVARDLEIRDNMLHTWKKKFTAEGLLQPATSSVEQELRRLREENKQLKIEREILKKRRPSLPKKITEISVHLSTSLPLANYDSMSSIAGQS